MKYVVSAYLNNPVYSLLRVLRGWLLPPQVHVSVSSEFGANLWPLTIFPEFLSLYQTSHLLILLISSLANQSFIDRWCFHSIQEIVSTWLHRSMVANNSLCIRFSIVSHLQWCERSVYDVLATFSSILVTLLLLQLRQKTLSGAFGVAYHSFMSLAITTSHWDTLGLTVDRRSG